MKFEVMVFVPRFPFILADMVFANMFPFIVLKHFLFRHMVRIFGFLYLFGMAYVMLPLCARYFRGIDICSLFRFMPSM